MITEKPRLPLFRLEALQAQRPRPYGRIVLVRPLSFSVLTAAAVAAAAAIAAFLVWGSYTRHVTLVGQLVPRGGVIKVHTYQLGTIVEKRVAEGSRVAEGDVLFVISSERFSGRGATQRTIGRELERQERSLREQIEKTRLLEATERESLERIAGALRSEADKLEGAIESQRQRGALAASALERYERLRAQGFLSEDQLLTQRDNHLQQQSLLKSLERELGAVRRELTDLENEARSLPLRYESRLAELERALAATRRELSESEARRLTVVTAPRGGIATAVLGEVGQVVDSTRPLLSIVPDGSTLEAQLFAPSRAMGFIEEGDRVLLRYEAYPYQRFGHHEGTVTAVSRAAVPANELLGHIGAIDPAAGPLYRVSVRLASQTITAYGESHRLQAGMTVQADVLQDRRRLYEWILEPLYTLSGKIHR
ncbi:MAG TPA: HlyD family efflux transporter periplasmic adaptor subunit [Gammaproteobacteria bacterium]